MAIKMIVGLGNPGSKYQWTRHNAGFMVLDMVSNCAGIPINKKKFSGLFGEGAWNDEQVLLLKPQTYMNLSGRSVAEAVRFHKIRLKDLVVIHDEIDLPFGRLKLKEGGGHAGHNGLRSLVAELGSGDFARVRVGVGRPAHGDVADYVLSNFSATELAVLPELMQRTAEILAVYLRDGLGKAMSLFNNRDILE